MTTLVPLRELLSWERHTGFRFIHRDSKDVVWCVCALVLMWVLGVRAWMCVSTKALCVLQSSVHSSVPLVSVRVRTRSSLEVSQPILHLLSSPLLLSYCCPHRQSSMILLSSGGLLGESNFLWTCCQKGHPWSGSGGGQSLLVRHYDYVRPMNPGCSSWECL